MIGHPRIYPKLYTRKNLIIMILVTWIACFCSLIPVLMGKWGKFGLDMSIGSCSILFDDNGRSPKETLFIVAFVLPCLAIIVCYARIFWIVRKAAAASRASQSKASVRHIDEMKTSRPLESVSGSDESQRVSESTKSSGASDNDIIKPLYRPSVIRHRPLNTVLLFKDKHSSIRIEVDKGSEAVEAMDDETCDQSGSHNKIHSEYLLSPTTPLNYTTSMKRRASDSSAHFETDKLHRELSRRSSSLVSIKAEPIRPRTGSPALSNCSDKSNLRNMNLFGQGPLRRLSVIRVPNSGRLSSKDKRLLQMILVIFVSFFVCYMPITIVKLMGKGQNMVELNIVSYLLIYMTTCINPIVYVVMSSEYRQAYKNLLTSNTEVLRRTGTFMFSRTSNWN
ncbi:G-protein coupled receptor moody-like isoform X2 [Artemia franciscana]|uniref:G-protein coupled receptor moody-like isoform X2 n=1 Tax=Artemia franciscana TaxID=6661 RepID=UPI0032DAFF06